MGLWDFFIILKLVKRSFSYDHFSPDMLMLDLSNFKFDEGSKG